MDGSISLKPFARGLKFVAGVFSWQVDIGRLLIDAGSP
jgi:hypothetical protein